jgi:hypothetical protein
MDALFTPSIDSTDSIHSEVFERRDGGLAVRTDRRFL